VKWTTDKPTEAGWYWYRGPLSEDQPMVVHVFDVGRIFYSGPWPDGRTVRLERSFGEPDDLRFDVNGRIAEFLPGAERGHFFNIEFTGVAGPPLHAAFYYHLIQSMIARVLDSSTVATGDEAYDVAVSVMAEEAPSLIP
jgi:hypothetical protein